MNVSYFIGISSAVLLTWLGVTYFHHVPLERYPKQNRFSSDNAINTPLESEETVEATVSMIE
jgi:hypothetical protein